MGRDCGDGGGGMAGRGADSARLVSWNIRILYPWYHQIGKRVTYISLDLQPRTHSVR